MIEAIIFDKDGTLTDFHATWSAGTRSIFRAIVGDDPERHRRMGAAIGFDWDTGEFASGSVGVSGPESALLDALSGAVPELDRSELERRYFAASGTVVQQPAVSLRPFFEGLRADGFVLGVVTNDNAASARRQLAEFEVLPLLDFVAGADSGFGAKPGPGMLLAFAEATGMAPERTLMVGDTLHDLHAAASAGMPALAVLTGAARKADLAPFAEAVLPDIGHLPRWLAGR